MSTKNTPEYYDQCYLNQPNRWRGNKDADESVIKNVPQPKSVIDIGCGTGRMLKLLSERWPRTVLYGVDFSGVAIERARKIVPECTFIHGVIDDVKDTFDVALLLGVAEHFEDMNELGKVKNILNKGGLIYLIVPNCMSSKNSKEGFYKDKYGVQEEWHLFRSTWEIYIREQGYNIVKSIVGKLPAWEFTWVLEVK